MSPSTSFLAATDIRPTERDGSRPGTGGHVVAPAEVRSAHPGAGRLPRFGRGLAVLPVDGGLVIEGADQRRRFGGAAAISVLPTLLPALDGATGPTALARRCGVRDSDLMRLLDALDGCGALEWVDPQAGRAPGLTDDVTDYLSRVVGGSTAYGCVEDIAADLVACSALIVGAGPVGGLVAEDLVETGVGDVQIRDRVGAVTEEDLDRLAAAGQGLLLVHDVAGAFAGIVARLGPRPVTVLRYHHRGVVVEIGPVRHAEWMPCPHGLDSGAAADAGDHGTDLAPATIAGLLAAEALLLLTGLGPANPPWRIRRISTGEVPMELFDVIPDGCIECDRTYPGDGDGGGPAGRAEATDEPPAGALATAYERQCQWRVSTVELRRATAKQQKAIAAMKGVRNPMLPAPRRRLGIRPVPAVPPVGTAAPASVDGRLLADLLARTAGAVDCADGRAARRWAPSAGNLASVQVYLAAAGDPFQLPGTVFRYDDLRHEVVSCGAERIPLDELLAGTDLSGASVEATLFLVAEVGRLSRKYDDFAVRLAHLDAGVTALHLALVAAAYGLDVTFASRWDDRLARRLELDTPAELVTAVAALRPRPGDGQRTTAQPMTEGEADAAACHR